MRLITWMFMLLIGVYFIGRYKYRILNTLLAVDIIRKVVVSVTMRLPYIREKILPQILGRSTI